MYEMNRRITLSATVVYGSGDKAWVPVGRFTFQDVPGVPLEFIVPDYGDQRNNIRLPYFQRTDFAVIYKFFPKWGESDLTLSFFNVTNRRNPFFIYLEPEYQSQDIPGGGQGDVPTGVAAKQVSLFPILGSLTWNFKF